MHSGKISRHNFCSLRREYTLYTVHRRSNRLPLSVAQRLVAAECSTLFTIYKRHYFCLKEHRRLHLHTKSTSACIVLSFQHRRLQTLRESKGSGSKNSNSKRSTNKTYCSEYCLLRVFSFSTFLCSKMRLRTFQIEKTSSYESGRSRDHPQHQLRLCAGAQAKATSGTLAARDIFPTPVQAAYRS